MDDERRRPSMDQDIDPPEDALLRREEAAAEREAGSIGGGRPEYDVDEAHRPLEESGEGEAEGFELAEHDLEETASHGDGGYDPELDEFAPEEESDRADTVYSEPDEVDPTEVVRDPREGEDDPGAGPGLTADR
jgi:hypothetical protein